MIWGVYSREVAISFFPATKRGTGKQNRSSELSRKTSPSTRGENLGVIKLNKDIFGFKNQFEELMDRG